MEADALPLPQQCAAYRNVERSGHTSQIRFERVNGYLLGGLSQRDRYYGCGERGLSTSIERLSVGGIGVDVAAQLAGQIGTEVKTPRAITSRSILANQSST